MIRVLINNWWLLAMRGIFALTFALFALSLQGAMGTWLLSAIALAGLVVLFGVLAFAAGACTIAAAVRGAEHHERWLPLLFDGVVVCIAGAVILVAPRLDLIWLARIVAAWAVVAGILELMVARRLRRHLPDEWLLALAGAASFCFGLYLFLVWNGEASTLLRWLTGYAAFSAAAILALAFRLRALRGSVHALAGRQPSTP
jgi:uncharacterized membrane protein HdeD (DUF308 family)